MSALAGAFPTAIPSLLAVAAAHGRLTERGLRTACSLLVSSDETRDTHMVATLLGYGAAGGACGTEYCDQPPPSAR